MKKMVIQDVIKKKLITVKYGDWVDNKGANKARWN